MEKVLEKLEKANKHFRKNLMGNRSSDMSNMNVEHIMNYKFLLPPADDTDNGLCFTDTYLPEEVVTLILSYIDPKVILKSSLVCRKWCKIIKSYTLWSMVYKRRYGRKAKKLPWYVFYCLFSSNSFDNNLLRNGNGEENFKHWHIIKNYGDEFKIEDPPQGSDPLPSGQPEFHGKTSCFATSFYECDKEQVIDFNRKLLVYIVNKYRPTIYFSEWVSGRFDSSCIYTLIGRLKYKDEEQEFTQIVSHVVEQWQGSSWTKKEIFMKDYPEGVIGIVFQHVGHDTLFWKGHYGSKMAGGVVKILFETIEPLDCEEDIDAYE